MSTTWLPCGTYHQNYVQDHAWWQTKFIKAKMLLLLFILFIIIPLVADSYVLSILNLVGYTILGAIGVQLLIGFCGQITLGHAAFIAVGAYTSTLLILEFPWPKILMDWGLAYPISILIAAIVSGAWSVLFGLPCARVKGFYLILTTMAAQFITVDFIITGYVSQIGGRGQAFSLPPGTIKVGPWIIDSDLKVYFMMLVLVIVCVIGVLNLIRSRVGRAWIAIRDNDISAEVMGINVVKYKLLAFYVAGSIGGVAGAFWISNLAAISPEHFPWFWSLWLVGVILIGGVGSIHGTIFGAVFMVVVMEMLQLAVIPLADTYPKLLMDFLFIKEAAFGLAICVFMIFEPNGLAYRWWQMKNYFNLWPFSY
ncbi:MAG: branched-chain amino acid ABC transporter permease [Deltaproteobacteria bacterium]|nr:branched-chain amino acid ABC transporter permease [Deltaproteobacteria bacterium]MBW1747058.1 branched-chain amino acid ABC transporter permease [Deltaproteobacteria bacterium]MBW1968684.1 branched-chain amino acid ABC transporter permease [Deltaproteobacteria bacterium]MBW2155442.1 branched-chain amino acid ABC transporter permease [Deltaproteobacteria bacterium]MBW2196659.1 branched-chain amino acid ABC transporter permease [Deltaproteobacteria bacterium]